MAFKRVKLKELLFREKTLISRLNNVTEWTPETARVANALTKLHEHLDDGVYEIPEDEWEELDRLTYYGG
ncbi:hypothetical protein [Phascolarctobacterium succinatutens]|uniref:hypothetical protein n=1 Tax=Phascolarctobacterium succinatutens TaxID=626940 RepID=UPI0026F174EE|nr:hypothetical protein [Phascolarctobacterium succinatutens]